MNVNKIITILAALVLSLSVPSFSEEKEDFKWWDLRYVLDKLDFPTYFTKGVKRDLAKKKIDVNFVAGLQQGFDNNAYLSPDRYRDGYLQTNFTGGATYNFTDDLRMGLDADVYYMEYYKRNKNDLLDLSATPHFEMDFLDDKLTFETDYTIEWVYFPVDDYGRYLSNEAAFFLKNKVLKNFYHKGGARLEYRHYTNRKVISSNKTRSSDLRFDERYTGEYEAAIYLFNRLKLKENIQFYRNDSNDQYYDYYDYWAFRAKTSLTAFIMDNLYVVSSFAILHKWYDDRLTTNNLQKEKDNNYIFNVSLMYDITKSITFVTGYSYRENVSNEPLEKYSGSVVNAGFYYTF